MKTKEQEIKEIQAFCDSIKNVKVTYNPELDKREGVSLFPEKVRKAKEVIAKGGLPKEYLLRTDSKTKRREKINSLKNRFL